MNFNTLLYRLGLQSSDFIKVMSFSSIANRYGLTTQRIIQLFDDNVSYIPKARMPYVLCIDEKGFKGDNDSPYCCYTIRS